MRWRYARGMVKVRSWYGRDTLMVRARYGRHKKKVPICRANYNGRSTDKCPVTYAYCPFTFIAERTKWPDASTARAK